jgi:hypothetical protein
MSGGWIAVDGNETCAADTSQLLSLERRFQLTNQRHHGHCEAVFERARYQVAKRSALCRELAMRGA